MQCKWCGTPVPDGSAFCSACGRAVESPAPAQSGLASGVPPAGASAKKSRTGIIIAIAAALILCVIVGVGATATWMLTRDETPNGGTARVDEAVAPVAEPVPSEEPAEPEPEPEQPMIVPDGYRVIATHHEEDPARGPQTALETWYCVLEPTPGGVDSDVVDLVVISWWVFPDGVAAGNAATDVFNNTYFADEILKDYIPNGDMFSATSAVQSGVEGDGPEVCVLRAISLDLHERSDAESERYQEILDDFMWRADTNKEAWSLEE